MDVNYIGFIRIMIITCLALPAGYSSGMSSSATKQQPNILYIMTDQQPVSCVSAYGNKIIKTPNLDKLAEAGCTFHSAYIAAFPCSPSRACQLSRRYAHNNGVVTNEVLFDEKIPSLGNICKAAGYDTAYFGKWHLSGNKYRLPREKDPKNQHWDWCHKRVANEKGFEFERVLGGTGEDEACHGFDTWVGGWKHYRTYLEDAGLGEYLTKGQIVGGHNNLPSGSEGTHIYSLIPEEHNVDIFLVGHAEKYIRTHSDTSRPWCMVVSFLAPHLPVSPPKPWDTMYSLDQVTLPKNHRDTLEEKPASQRTNTVCYKLNEWNDEQYKDYMRRYWGYCSYIDQQIGRVLEALRKTNQWNNTIILFTSDHGDMLTAHGMIYKLDSCGYEELYHVPTIISIPGVTKPGSGTDALVSNIDFLPTLLEAANIPLLAGMDGKSLVPLIKGRSSKHRETIFSDDQGRSLICRDKRYKLVLNWGKDELTELYDLKTDPGELKNLANDPQHEKVKVHMMQLILDWLRETKYPYAEIIATKAVDQSTWQD